MGWPRFPRFVVFILIGGSEVSPMIGVVGLGSKVGVGKGRRGAGGRLAIGLTVFVMGRGEVTIPEGVIMPEVDEGVVVIDVSGMVVGTAVSVDTVAEDDDVADGVEEE